jgi:Asp-tRNA(Asn)/Glu-tRNA(Gln) amidotransferase A subunit family amidase
MEGITLAVDKLRRRNFSCQRIERHAWPGGAREAFALSDDAGAPVDYLVLRTGLPFDVTGVPAISLPIGPPDGVSPPAALQIVGKPGYDGELLQIAEQIERLLRQAWKPERRKNP